MFKRVTLQNFRGFNNFCMHDLGRINLLVGTNNSGKTSVLEALELLSSRGDTRSLWSAMRRRGKNIWDADESLEAKWHALRARCIQSFPEMPDELPPGGVVVENMSKKRFGAWVLPDNRSRGMMETFLSFLVPSEQDSLWQYAIAATNQARDHGAKYRDAHGDKACIHTWLAWSDPPGRQLHQAVIERILDPNSQHAQGFVRWFRALYEI